MKKIILYVIIMFINPLITTNAIGQCPFSYTVYISGAGASILNIQVDPDNPQNPNVKYTINNRWFINKWFFSKYFMIYEDETGCKNDHYGQATVFYVTVGSEPSPPKVGQYGSSPDLTADRPGRNCILTLIAGPNQNLELYPPYPGGINCTHNIQLDVTRKNQANPLNPDANTGSGDTIQWAPYSQPDHNGPIIGLGDIKHKVDADYYYYPTFSTPKN